MLRSVLFAFPISRGPPETLLDYSHYTHYSSYSHRSRQGQRLSSSSDRSTAGYGSYQTSEQREGECLCRERHPLQRCRFCSSPRPSHLPSLLGNRLLFFLSPLSPLWPTRSRGSLHLASGLGLLSASNAPPLQPCPFALSTDPGHRFSRNIVCLSVRSRHLQIARRE